VATRVVIHPVVREARAALVVGTSAHVFQGVEENVLYDLGDFLDDYRVHRRLRNDHGLLILFELGPERPQRIEAVPLKLEYAHTRLARGPEADWIRRRFRRACSELGTVVFSKRTAGSSSTGKAGPLRRPGAPLSLCPIVRRAAEAQKFYKWRTSNGADP
jgi:hypothetical protein